MYHTAVMCLQSCNVSMKLATAQSWHVSMKLATTQSWHVSMNLASSEWGIIVLYCS